MFDEWIAQGGKEGIWVDLPNLTQLPWLGNQLVASLRFARRCLRNRWSEVQQGSYLQPILFKCHDKQTQPVLRIFCFGLSIADHESRATLFFLPADNLLQHGSSCRVLIAYQGKHPPYHAESFCSVIHEASIRRAQEVLTKCLHYEH